MNTKNTPKILQNLRMVSELLENEMFSKNMSDVVDNTLVNEDIADRIESIMGMLEGIESKLKNES